MRGHVKQALLKAGFPVEVLVIDSGFTVAVDKTDEVHRRSAPGRLRRRSILWKRWNRRDPLDNLRRGGTGQFGIGQFAIGQFAIVAGR